MSQGQALSWVHRPLRLPSRKTWRRVLKVVVTLLLLSALVIGAIEGWRQWTFVQARAERDAALDRINAHFAEVEDFGPWFDSHAKGTQGGAARLAAADNYEAARKEIGRLIVATYDIPTALLEGRHARTDARVDDPSRDFPPDAPEWREYLRITKPHMKVVEGLLKFDSLHNTPRAGAEESPAAMFRGFDLLRMSCERATVHLYVGDHASAVHDALIANQVGQRLRNPQCLDHAMELEAMSSCLHRLIAALATRVRLTDSELSALAAQNTPVSHAWLEALRGYLALIASSHRAGTYPYDHISCESYDRVFGWLLDDRFGVAENYARYFVKPAESYRYDGKFLDSLLNELKNLESGGVPDNSQVWSSGGWLFGDMTAANLYRSRSRALLEIRQRESRGEHWNEIAGTLTGYPWLTISSTDGAITVGFIHTEQVRRALSVSMPSDIDAKHPPVVMRPFD